MPPILDRSILETTAEYPVVFSAVFQDFGSAAPELRVARIDLEDVAPDGAAPVARPSRLDCATFTLNRAGDDPEQLTVNAHAGRGLGFSIIGIAHKFTIPSWPITLGEIPPDAGGGVWAMIACPRDVTLAFVDAPRDGAQ
ncbi:hypothetical protein [Gordonia rubripertincta]|uniref:hypothetical protein n=1 Tax=Gordonia rubripertincta TaxID=36822 RepID=UPI0015FA2F77|nr:hypothetical protein [Gordonia rubripertincta]QMU22026.1 hypothetical protein H3V45_05925 [Gordonia rubripertincta]